MMRKNINTWDKIDMLQMYQNDLKLRKIVSEIAAEGCLKSSQDYLAAALIFQHGETPDHYYQAYLWAKRALELGDKNAKAMIAMTIDRYLVSIGKKQLFGSQYSKCNRENCYCREQTEIAFPDSLRQEYLGKTLVARSKEMSTLFNRSKKCPNIECTHMLKPTLQGTIPGLW